MRPTIAASQINPKGNPKVF